MTAARPLIAALASAALATACDRAAPTATPTTSQSTTETPPVAVATVASSDPGTDALRAWKSFSSADGGFTVRWATEPDPIVARDPFTIFVELFEDAACTKPQIGGSVEVDAAMPHHGHGMNVRPKIVELGPGRYRAEGMLFHMPGRWELFVDRTENGQTERAQATITLHAAP